MTSNNVGGLNYTHHHSDLLNYHEFFKIDFHANLCDEWVKNYLTFQFLISIALVFYSQ